MKRLLLIYNPNAGRQKARTYLPTLLEVFAANGYLTTTYPTKGRGDAAMAASALAGGYDRVVCCGGDGTLNEAVSGLMEVPEGLRPPLGYIPTGTANDFSHNFSLPRGPAKLAEVACTGVLHSCDLGQANGRWFTYVAAFGLFTDVAYATPQNTKNLLGHAAYLLEGASRLTSLKTYRVKVEADGICTEDDFLFGMVGNTVSVGGLVKLPSKRIKLDDGLFEVILIRKPHSAADYQTALRTLTTQNLTEDGPLIGFATDKVTFTCTEPLPWTLDGEFGGEPVTTVVENRPRALVLACGK